MDLQKLVLALTQEEKDELIAILTQGRIEKATDSHSIESFISTYPDMSLRVKNTLRGEYKETTYQEGKKTVSRHYFKNLDEVTEERFLSVRNGGKKSWSEFEKLNKDYLNK